MTRLARAIWRLPGEIWAALVGALPGPLGYRLRLMYWRKRVSSMGSSVKIERFVQIKGAEYISIGDNAWIDQGVVILAGPDRSERHGDRKDNPAFQGRPGTLHIGSQTHIAPYVVISAIGGVHIGKGCGIAAGCRVYSFSHHYRSEVDPTDHNFFFTPLVGESQQFMIDSPVVIEDNVGVAVNSVILPGVTIGGDSFVAAGAVVGKSFEENSLVVGNPATRLRDRFEG